MFGVVLGAKPEGLLRMYVAKVKPQLKESVS